MDLSIRLASTRNRQPRNLKGLLAFHEQPIARTHDTEELQRLCLDVLESSELEEVDLTVLSDYAVSGRYDLDFWPDRETARGAIELAQRVRAAVLPAVPKEAKS